MTYNNKQVFDTDTFSFQAVKIGDFVTGDVVDDLMDMLPPACMRADCSQIGEPYAHRFDDQRNRYRATYDTFSRVGYVDGAAVWEYRGDCFLGENVQRGELPPYIS